MAPLYSSASRPQLILVDHVHRDHQAAAYRVGIGGRVMTVLFMGLVAEQRFEEVRDLRLVFVAVHRDVRAGAVGCVVGMDIGAFGAHRMDLLAGMPRAIRSPRVRLASVSVANAATSVCVSWFTSRCVEQPGLRARRASANAALIEVGSRRTGRVQRRGSAVGAGEKDVRTSGACGTGRPLLTCTPMGGRRRATRGEVISRGRRRCDARAPVRIHRPRCG